MGIGVVSRRSRCTDGKERHSRAGGEAACQVVRLATKQSASASRPSRAWRVRERAGQDDHCGQAPGPDCGEDKKARRRLMRCPAGTAAGRGAGGRRPRSSRRRSTGSARTRRCRRSACPRDGSRMGRAASTAAERELRGARAVGEEAVVADAMEAVRQGVQQEAADELVGRRAS